MGFVRACLHKLAKTASHLEAGRVKWYLTQYAPYGIRAIYFLCLRSNMARFQIIKNLYR